MREEIMEKIVKAVNEKYEKECDVLLRKVEKNNGVLLHAIIIKESETTVCPSIYIDQMLNEIERGYRDVDDVALEVIEIYKNALKDIDSIKENVISISKETILNNVGYQLINAEKNKHRLCNMPHRLFLDLAVIYKVDFGKCEFGYANITVDNDLCNKYAINRTELEEAAIKNTANNQFDIKSLNSLIFSAMGIEESDECDEFDLQIYVVTNKKKVNGAAAMLYDAHFKELASDLGSDLYILPSSVHEILVAPTDVHELESLMRIVGEVNSTEVSEDDFLSNNVYKYIRSENRIIIAKEGE